MSVDEKKALRAMRAEWLANVEQLFGTVQAWHKRFVKRCKPSRLQSAIEDQRNRINVRVAC